MKLKLGSVVRHKENDTYGLVNYSSFGGYSIHMYDKENNAYGKTLGMSANELLEHWEVCRLPKGYKRIDGWLRKDKTNNE